MHASARSARSRIGDLPQSHAARAAGRAVRATTADAQQVCAETFGSKHKSAAITVWIEALLAFQAPRARFLWVEARRLGLLLVPSKPSLHLGLYQRHDGIRRASRSAKHRCSQSTATSQKTIWFQKFPCGVSLLKKF